MLYNLPPKLAMKEQFMFLALVIPSRARVEHTHVAFNRRAKTVMDR